MKQQRKFIILLVVGLAITFGLQNLFLSAYSNPIQGVVGYLILVLAIITIILVPFAWRSPVMLPILIWSVLLFVYRFLLMGESLLSEQIYILLAVAELAILSLTLLITHRLAMNLREFEEGVEVLTLVDNFRTAPTIDSANDAIKKEMRRGRFYQRPVSLIVLEPANKPNGVGANGLIREVQESLLARYDKARIRQSIGRQVRSIDILMKGQNEDHLIVFCPEMGADESEELVHRIRQSVENEMGMRLRYATSSFPEEGLTFNALLQSATAQLKETETPVGTPPDSVANQGSNS